MIVDSLHNAAKYYGLHPNFKKAFDYVNQNDIANLEEGAFEIGEGLKLIVIVGQGNTKEEAVKGFECHDKNIDIQISIKGPETFAWKPREKCVNPNGDYSDERDVRFFHDAPDTFFQLQEKQFAILFPEDVHTAMIGEGELKKIVIKVKI
ncbi:MULTISPECIES: YhcH/YjgK/YiaL family protein [unclassified Flavobacterium]|jgi:YhcH/YjgK/YiaL family protein|uniref:YhcH/YjgK/YiaL family protein n=1 Tax=unclassified Flavobacterium TaxID=196869 RepID=UPI00106592C7|nr:MULTISPECIES: YhcH/YjgK/YiaL family protein [unclassified Flavobacterium]TDX09802.1 YhcH/YjgK/YiaL family protein [Flavobacterium sp. S87F.05.LMB.W.Kidney.N]BDU26772.1 beta-D-galactosidase [Flavobacterium sp. GSB-24]